MRVAFNHLIPLCLFAGLSSGCTSNPGGDEPDPDAGAHDAAPAVDGSTNPDAHDVADAGADAAPDAGTDPPPLDFDPLCYDEAGGTVVDVSNCSQLQSALGSAAPGDVIVLADGTYDCDVTAAGNGTAADPIVMRSANALGARFNNREMTLGGDYIVVAAIDFDDASITITGDHNRVTRNRFRNGQGPAGGAVTVDRSDANRLDHNEVRDFGIGDRAFRIVPSDTSGKDNVIDRNHFLRSLGPNTNGAEAIQIGTGRTHTWNEPNAIIEYNLFEQWEIDGEVISNKSSANTIRFNTFNDHLRGKLSLRHGSRTRVLWNYFVAGGGLAIFGRDHEIIGNYFEDAHLIVERGDCRQDDVPTADGCHPAAENTLVAANTVTGSGTFCVGCRFPNGGSYSGEPARNTVASANSPLTPDYDDHVGTEVNSTYSGQVETPVRLYPSDVGPASPDVCD